MEKSGKMFNPIGNTIALVWRKKMNRQEEWADELRADGYKGVSKDTTK